MYLIKYTVLSQKTIRNEGFIFTDYITKNFIEEKSIILDTENEVKRFSDELKKGHIISITKI